jgi:hypothetical protein
MSLRIDVKSGHCEYFWRFVQNPRSHPYVKTPITTVKDRLVLKIYPFFRDPLPVRTLPALIRGCLAGYRIFSTPRFKYRVFSFFDFPAIWASIACPDLFQPSPRPPKTFPVILFHLAGRWSLDQLSDPASFRCRGHDKGMSCC